MYKLIPVNYANRQFVRKLSDGSCIPTDDPSNLDYQAYLKWLDEGNTPETEEQQ